MYLNKKVVAIIPAKHKSHDLPRKNYLKLKKISLYELAIKSAQNSKYVDLVVVTSDSDNILNSAKKKGALIIKRNKKLCSKNTPANDVIYHAIKKIKNKIPKEFIILYLQPTSPFRNHKHINSAFKKLKSKKMQSLISVRKSKKTIFKSLKLKNGLIKPIFDEKFVTTNRQQLNTSYHPNGAIYIFSSNKFMKNKKIPIINSLAYEMSENSSHDIDTLEDYKIAKQMSKKFLIYK